MILPDLSRLSTYDIESFPNFFSFTLKDRATGQWYVFEDSERKNEIPLLKEWLWYWKHHNYSQIGFNNIGYDYPMVHHLLSNDWVNNYADMYKKNEQIINTPWDNRFSNIIPEWKTLIPQIDLLKIHHFDNKARLCSLKQLEYVMRSKMIEDLPYEPGKPIPSTDEAHDKTIQYNCHDVGETDKFADLSYDDIEFRVNLSNKYGINFINDNMGKIGEKIFIGKLNKAGVRTKDENGNKIQTWREFIDLADVIFPYITFDLPQFQQLLAEVRKARIYETKGAYSVSTVINGFEYPIKLGGIHVSVKGQSIYADDYYMIEDWDVESFYPRMGILNRVYPEHLTDKFPDVYNEIFQERRLHKKGTPENKGLKESLNVAYGNSNSEYSPFYDPKYTMTITINGQFLLLMIADKLLQLSDMHMIQMNTDGLTIKYPRHMKDQVHYIMNQWMSLTMLNLERVEYKRMVIRDVNNYLAEDIEGNVKYVGAYTPTGAHETDRPFKERLRWDQNHSALVVQKAATAAILNNTSIREFITSHQNIYDFFLLCKIKRTDGLELQVPIMWGDSIVFEKHTLRKLQKTTRYLVTNQGQKLIKTMPPLKRRGSKVAMYLPGWRSKKLSGGLNKNLTVETQGEYDHAVRQGYLIKDGGTFTHTPIRENNVEAGYLVQIFNKVESEDVKDYDINYEYYIKEAEKLVSVVI